MERYELNKLLEDLETRIIGLLNSLNVSQLENKYQDLLKKQLSSDFWSDVVGAQRIIEESNDIKEKIDKMLFLKKNLKSIKEFNLLASDNSDDYLLLVEEARALEKALKEFELITLLGGKYDKSNCLLELHPGAGGTESADWCMMLYRMYIRYITKKKYKYEIIDYQPGEEAGLKSVSILVKGKYAYGNLKSEKGVHRLVRISPFDANKRRHTSFVSCDVVPEIDDLEEVKINEEDLRIDVFRSSSAGGQSVNTTDSAVRITHLPSGLVVSCQNQRSQIKNKETALKVLKSRLRQLEESKRQAEINVLKGEQKDIAWGSQIRSYVFHPYQMVKDHRTNYETSQTDQVMDGNLDEFINSYLRQGKA